MSRFLALLAAVACGSLLLVGGAAGRPVHRAHCAVPRGWKVVARDTRVVVASYRNPARHLYEWRYCATEDGRFRSLYTDRNDIYGLRGLFSVRVAGPYVAYIHYVSPQGPGNATCDVHMIQATSGGRATVADPTHGGLCQRLQLTATGVLAALAFNAQATIGYIVAYSFPDRRSYVLDSGPSENFDPEPIALYQCASGCSPRAVIVAWTDNGTWRYASIDY